MRRFVLLLTLAVFSFLTSCRAAEDQVCVNNHCVQVEIVKDPDDMARGLQFRKNLNANAGMLFIFPETGTYPFWMKDTLIPLDLVWIDENKKVVSIEENVPICQSDPCPTYDPKQSALYVLEVNAGHAREVGLQPGVTAVFNLPSQR